MRRYKLKTNGNYLGHKAGEIGVYVSSGRNGVTLKLSNNEELYFCNHEVELIEERPERYASREVNGMDVLDLINHWNLNFSEGCILKYLLRDKGEDISDFKKIADYANREVKRLEDCK